MPRIFNNLKLKERRRILRNNQTESEKILWQRLRREQIKGIKFNRQYGIGAYIADFYAAALRLCIEVDGEQHYTKTGKEYDAERDNYMESLNIKILRFKNELVMEDIENVVTEIKKAIESLLDSKKE